MSSNMDLSITSKVDVNVWRSIIGASIEIPPVDTYVYYFPQGHLEQSSPTSYSDNPITYNFILLRPLIPCQVLSVDFLAKYSSDQPFVRMILQPLRPLGQPPSDDDDDNDNDEDEDDNDDVVSFVKILTRSDTNVGGFSIPRYCADMILPPLDYTPETPVQTIVMKDVHNNEWKFRHVYRGTPRRHVLTAGWGDFVVAKRLVAGDSVVLIKKKLTGELIIGIRRETKFSGDRGDGPYERRRALGSIATAARGEPFEVVYFPGGRVPEFVVKAEKVKEAIQRRWSPGMRVRMVVETDDSSRLIWIQGVIVAVSMPTNGMWCGSPWRVLQICWDDTESVHMKIVSPWQVERVTQTPPNDPHYHPRKRLKAALVPTDGESSSNNGAHICTSSSSTVNELSLAPSNGNSIVQLKDGSSTFQLFGKTIKVPRPPAENEGCSNLSLSTFTRFYFI